MISAREALERLREGNGRFVSGAPSDDTLTSQTGRSKFAAGQEPFAIILGCSDSRVPAEIVFDQGLGICLSSVSPETLSLPLKSAVSSSPQSGSAHGWWWFWGIPSAGLFGQRWKNFSSRRTINRGICVRSSDRVRPSVEALLSTELRHDPEALVRHAVRAHVCISASQLRHGSEVLEQLI